MSVPAPPVICCNPKHRHPSRKIKSHLPIRIAERFVPWIRAVHSSLPIMPAQRSKGEHTLIANHKRASMAATLQPLPWLDPSRMHS